MEYVVPPTDEHEEDTHSVATTEQMDEETEDEADASLHQASPRKPQHVPMTVEIVASSGSSEATEEDVDIDGATKPVLHDEYWEEAYPNSPITTPLMKVPQSPARTEEIHTGSEERQPSPTKIKPSLHTIAEETQLHNLKMWHNKT